jgi:hypothetical protein
VASGSGQVFTLVSVVAVANATGISSPALVTHSTSTDASKCRKAASFSTCRDSSGCAYSSSSALCSRISCVNVLYAVCEGAGISTERAATRKEYERRTSRCKWSTACEAAWRACAAEAIHRGARQTERVGTQVRLVRV